MSSHNFMHLRFVHEITITSPASYVGVSRYMVWPKKVYDTGYSSLFPGKIAAYYLMLLLFNVAFITILSKIFILLINLFAKVL
jgi:hypothetical protein